MTKQGTSVGVKGGGDSGHLLSVASEVQVGLHSVAHQLQSFGRLLERQGAEEEGDVELRGLGIALTGLSREVFALWSKLDQRR